MNESDFTHHVSNLLDIAERCTGHSGKLSHLQAWAIGELISINNGIKTERSRPKPTEPEHQLEPEPQPKPPEDGADIHTADNPNPNLRRI